MLLDYLFDGIEYYYEPSQKELKSALSSFILSEWDIKQSQQVVQMMLEIDAMDNLCEYYKEELTNYFESNAYKEYQNEMGSPSLRDIENQEYYSAIRF